MKKPRVIFFILFIILLSFYWFYRQNSLKTVNPSESGKVVNLLCSSGYEMKARYSAPDKNGILIKLSLTVGKDGTTTVYDMAPAMSGSGSKFETEDQKYSLWEHQGEFTFSIDGVDQSVCTEKGTRL
jgi:hypothetical protein